MLGPHHLNEVFLDNVRVGPRTCSDRSAAAGLSCATRWPTSGSGSRGTPGATRCSPGCRARSATGWDDLPPALHARWVRALVNLRVARLLAYRAVANQTAGIDPIDASAARIVTTTCDQVVAELLVEAVGATGLDAGPDAPIAGAIDDHWRYAQAATVSSGTIEVQRMLVAREILGGRL